MLVGDPYKFAIFINTVKEWNLDDTFYSGVLLFSVDGGLFPKEIFNTTLICEIQPLKEKLMNIVIDKKLYNMPKDEAFVEIYNITFSEDTDNDYRFDITPCEFSDHNCYVFAVGNGEQVRILAAADLNYITEDSRHELENINVSEAVVTIDELNEIISSLRIY
ncbi:MAG: immunity 42 family protein [Acutalibacteraceae bacterium]